MKKLWTILYLLFISSYAFAQYTVSGTIKDAKSQEVLAGVTVSIENTNKGTVTDGNGSFQLKNVAEGTYTLRFSFIGFQTFSKEIDVNGNLELTESLSEMPTFLKPAFVYALEEYPVTQSKVAAERLEKQNLGQDLPALLNYETSLVYTSDAGAGVGYTGLRIRGSDAQRINVTVNGIPLNDSESQGVFWVNMPDFTSSVQNITIQRGVGTSVNGAGAFGASINIDTKGINDEKFVEVNNSFGSFNTWRHKVAFNTGLINDKISLNGRLSKITSDGFIDRSAADLKSFFLSGNYKGKNSLLTFNIFSGQERTQQAWWGIPEAKLNGDAEGIQSYIDNNGLNEEQTRNIKESDDRTYNFYIYDNEVDNYQQDHYQLLYQADFGNWSSNSALHYTRGRGYFEQAKYDSGLDGIGIDDITIGGETITSSDYIVRRWLDNHFYGLIQSFNYKSDAQLGYQPVLDFVVGGGWNRYDGDHFGEILWTEFAGNSEIGDRYYESNGLKTDFNLYAKANYQLKEGLFLFGDLQVRTINYEIDGIDNDFRDITTSDDFFFFNPKAGLTYYKGNNRFYATFAIANKEPIRGDYTDNLEKPEHETLRNLEVGYSKTLTNARFAINYYLMDYKNQLIPTGQVNDVGGAIRTNIPESYRTGIELEGQVNLSNQFTVMANATFSQNKNRDFTEYVIDYADFSYITTELGDTDIAFSPNLIASSQLIYKPVNGLEFGLMSKYVGDQFLDNTANDDRKIEAYFTNDLRINYNFSTKLFKEVGINLLVNNIFNVDYETNGYTYAYAFGGFTVREDHFYPQAGTNFLLGLKVRF